MAELAAAVWAAAFPPGGAYDARGWVPRSTVWARVAFFLVGFLGLWAVLLLALRLLVPGTGPVHGAPRRVWALKGMVLCHHMAASLWAIAVLARDPVLWRVLTFRGGETEARAMFVAHPLQLEASALLLPFTVAYMSADLLLFRCWSKDPEALIYFFHHGLSIFYWAEGLRFDSGVRYALYFISNELSGPPMVLRWMLSQAGMKSGLLYAANGTLFTLLFLLVRVLPIPAVLRSTALYFPLREPWKVQPPSPYLRCLQVSGCLAVFLPLALNSYWATKVVKGYAKALQSWRADRKAGKAS